MSEKLMQPSPEQRPETVIATTERPAAAEYSADEQARQIERAQAVVAAETARSEKAKPPIKAVDDRPHLIDHSIKALRLRQNMAQVRQRLTPADRALSKVIHQPLISKLSNTAAQTVSRPSGLLGGGLTAFVGSLVYLYMARSIGFNYNFLFFLTFFGGGFILGVGAEYLAYWLRRWGVRRAS